jgi:YhcH/YjgK/YiaL family protein
MILDALSQAERYYAVQPRLQAGFEFLRSADLDTLSPGRHAIDGDRLFVSIGDELGRGAQGARLEAHRSYIDIQVAVSSSDLIGWRPLADCRRISEPYDSGRDIMFFADEPQTWLALLPGWFAVFFPEDAHAPLAGQGPLRKAVVKVAVD